jgi:hypothetical protein
VRLSFSELLTTVPFVLRRKARPGSPGSGLAWLVRLVELSFSELLTTLPFELRRKARPTLQVLAWLGLLG